ncbi:hypothetical protein DTO166G4_5918 [Paecilomyces variotii]|nr:hypothetical protein DTO166G4_5918 [Paecilomyces variotii]KAJ9292141.1 hypothetical protein DTO021C3_34 [Paecilomyces variotii]
MKPSLYDRLLRRETGETSHYAGIPGIYGAREWIDDLDIVNELGGHTGCVNALSWSRSGRLLASGSDDQHLNIYSYQPDSSTAPFALNTTVATGHSANIFSVKFMPHSNDQTLVTCAGDAQVRVFDIEYSSGNGNGAASSAFEASARSRRFNNFFTGARYLTAGNTNARVYRSHADRVKRVVTESSPYLFMTCSEDGEVRQWDLRQPSSAYPSPRGGQGFMAYRPGLQHDDSNVPPPLISYKRYQLDLNTISCSSSQPHYIALGGAHLHCFLHDRRMLGRDLLAEKGDPGSPSPAPGTPEDETMGQATRCVRRFAPNGRRKMRRNDNGHITACKISDANPNEMVVSWSGDHIYSFDLIQSPDAREAQEREETLRNGNHSGRRRHSKDRKRKRKKTSMTSLDSGNRHHSRMRSESDEGDSMSFRVRYGNGESEDIPIPSLSRRSSDTPEDVMERARYSVLNEAQRLSYRIAKALVKLRKTLFSLEASVREAAESQQDSADITPYTASFTSALGYAASYLPEMDETIRTWRYPVNPTPDEVIFQQTLRRNRESTRRFVQAAGTLARVLGGRLQTASGGESPELEMFRQIEPAPTEHGIIDSESQFGYDFLKAILLWLEGDRQALLNGFKYDPARRRDRARFPVPQSAGDEAIEEILIPYLEELAGSAPVVNVDASRFERDESRIVFDTQSSAVKSFANAIKIPLEDLDGASVRVEDGEERPCPSNVRAMDRRAAMRFWGLKVGRSILMQAGDGVNFELVNRAFGGLRTSVEEDKDDDDERERVQEDIDPDEEEEPVEEVRLIRGRASAARRSSSHSQDTSTSRMTASNGGSSADSGPDDEVAAFSSSDVEMPQALQSDGDDEGNSDDDQGEESEDGESDQDDEDDESEDDEDELESEEDIFFRQTGFQSSRRRENVHRDVPCSSHTRVYRGHCNVKTVKDVNYFGLDDEYVVSGSDSGHLFIWDRKTSNLVNILEGDGEVVNVIEGHPYEPTVACSGIDNTIKIFSPDRRAQGEAHAGKNILDPDNAANTLGRHGVSGLGLKSRKRMQDSYQIMSRNDVDRQGGMTEAFVTRSMLSRLAATLRQRQTLGGIAALGGEVGEGTTIVLDENCTVM